ncbi:hypothetical protein ACFPYN_11880 [Paenisporosarcina macmurdoensis]|uniref:Uncharacterized protein n=1 Tax=Paenisporosarcina macmurdoensis TaxID=212659 RepID=A0ABW1L820_9BACL
MTTTKNEDGTTTIQGENGLMTELSEFGMEIQNRITERQQPLKDIASYYDEAKRVETEAIEKAEAYALSQQPAKALSTDEQIANLTNLVAELTKQMGAK